MSKPADRPPFRADHVGSLLRPESLAKARSEFEAGRIGRDALAAIEDECVREAVALQEGVGLKGITDGDMRRGDWLQDFQYAIDGIGQSGKTVAIAFSGGKVFHNPIAAVTGRVRCPEGGIMLEAFKFLKATTHQTAKLCIPAPSMFYNSVRQKELESGGVYDDWEEFWADLSSAYATAVQQYADAGCTYIQIDDVNAAKTGDKRSHEQWKAQGFTVADMVDRFITVNNDAIKSRPQGVTCTVHMCRGNFESEYSLEGGYDFMAERYFDGVKADAFFMEYDDARSGGFEPLRFMPRDRYVVLGLITSKRPQLEDKDLIKRRIDEATKYVDLDRLCLSPQCGFASTEVGNRLTQDEQKRKLEHVVEIATEVWGGV